MPRLYVTQLAIACAPLSARSVPVPPSNIVDFHTGDRERFANATCSVSGAQPPVPKRYKELKVRVQDTVDRYLSSEILVYLRAIAHLSHS